MDRAVTASFVSLLLSTAVPTLATEPISVAGHHPVCGRDGQYAVHLQPFADQATAVVEFNVGRRGCRHRQCPLLHRAAQR